MIAENPEPISTGSGFSACAGDITICFPAVFADSHILCLRAAAGSLLDREICPLKKQKVVL